MSKRKLGLVCAAMFVLLSFVDGKQKQEKAEDNATTIATKPANT